MSTEAEHLPTLESEQTAKQRIGVSRAATPSSMPSRPDYDCSWAEPGDMLADAISTPLDLKSCHLLEGLPRLSLWPESGHKP
jgi:hypothetical protein